VNPDLVAQRIADLIKEVERNGDEPAGVTDPYLQRLRDVALTTEQMKNLKQPPWLIDGVLQAESLAEVYGKPGSYKSFLTASWAMHIATGLDWCGHQVEPGPVIYLASEGAHGFGNRITAWEARHDYNLPNRGEWAPITWLPLAVSLGNAAWGEALGKYAAELGAALIVVDTRARNTVGLDENSAKDMGTVVEHLDHARSLSGSCVLLVHHSNAMGDKSRGSTAVEGAVDTELSAKKVDGVVTIRLEKQKNGRDGMEWQFRPTASVVSIVLEPVEAGTGTLGVTDAGLTMVATLRDIHMDDGVSYSRWLEAGDVPKATFSRQIKALVEGGFVAKAGRFYAPLGVGPGE